MFIIIIHFIEKVRPHTFFNEIVTEEISRCPDNPYDLVFAMVKNRYDEFYFFDREVNIINEEEEMSGPKHYSNTYIIGNIYDVESVGLVYGIDSILYNKLIIENAKYAVQTYLGRWLDWSNNMVVYRNL